MTGANPETRPLPAEHRSGPSFAAIMTGLILLGVGVVWLLDITGALSISWFVVLAIVLVAVGLALIAGSFTGEHGGLIAIGVILTVLLTGASWTDTRFEGGIGERNVNPASFEDLNDSYRLAAGPLEIDLRQIDFPPGETTLDIRVGAGEAIVIVPEDVAVEVDWRVVAGDVTIFDQEQSGLILEDRITTEGYQQADSQLVLDIVVTLGTIEVRR